MVLVIKEWVFLTCLEPEGWGGAKLAAYQPEQSRKDQRPPDTPRALELGVGAQYRKVDRNPLCSIVLNVYDTVCNSLLQLQSAKSNGHYTAYTLYLEILGHHVGHFGGQGISP